MAIVLQTIGTAAELKDTFERIRVLITRSGTFQSADKVHQAVTNILFASAVIIHQVVGMVSLNKKKDDNAPTIASRVVVELARIARHLSDEVCKVDNFRFDSSEGRKALLAVVEKTPNSLRSIGGEVSSTVALVDGAEKVIRVVVEELRSGEQLQKMLQFIRQIVVKITD